MPPVKTPLFNGSRLGETVVGVELGFNGSKTCKYIWTACIGCGRERWVQAVWGKPGRERCRRCAHWQGGRKVRGDGYIELWLDATDFFRPMSRSRVSWGSYVLEHRLVMARFLGRNLQSWELIHHKNGIKDDNRLENLELTTRGSHTLAHGKGYRDGYTKGLNDGRDSQIEELREEIRLLRQQLNGSEV